MAKKTSSATPGKAVLKPAEVALSAGKETVEAVVKAGTEAAQERVKQAVALTQVQVEKASSACVDSYDQAVAMTNEQAEKCSLAAFKSYDEITAMSKQNLDAVALSTRIYAKGMEKLGKEMMIYSQSSLNATVAAGKAMMDAKSPREVIEMQNDFARSSFDAMIAESGKLAEMWIKLSNEAMEPLQVRLNAAAEKAFTPIAA